MTPQDFGRATEARFLFDAQRRGLLVSRPFDTAPGYDAIVDTGSRLFRVQIKGARSAQGADAARRSRFPVYRINVNRRDRRQPNFDVIAVWLDEDARWIFLPRSIRSKRAVYIFTYGHYGRRGWEIFRTHLARR
jgi:hypothetical protein